MAKQITAATEILLWRNRKKIATEILLWRNRKKIATEILLWRNRKKIATEILLWRNRKKIATEILLWRNRKKIATEILLWRNRKKITINKTNYLGSLHTKSDVKCPLIFLCRIAWCFTPQANRSLNRSVFIIAIY